MKIYSFVRMVWDKELKRYVTVEAVSRDYSGPLALCWNDDGEDDGGFGAADFGGGDYGGEDDGGFGAADFGGDPGAQSESAFGGGGYGSAGPAGPAGGRGPAGPAGFDESDLGSGGFGQNVLKEALQVTALTLGFTGNLPLALGSGLLYGGYQAFKGGVFGTFDAKAMGFQDPGDRQSAGGEQVKNEPTLGYAANSPIPSVDSDEVLKKEAADKSKKLEEEARKRVGYLSMRLSDPFSVYQPLQVTRPQLTGAMG